MPDGEEDLSLCMVEIMIETCLSVVCMKRSMSCDMREEMVSSLLTALVHYSRQ